jgi:hypothetical protein
MSNTHESPDPEPPEIERDVGLQDKIAETIREGLRGCRPGFLIARDITSLPQIQAWRSHSVMLNTVGTRLGAELGKIEPEAVTYEGDVMQDLQELLQLVADLQFALEHR